MQGSELHLAGGEGSVCVSPPPLIMAYTFVPFHPAFPFSIATLEFSLLEKMELYGVRVGRAGWLGFGFGFCSLSLCPGWGSNSGYQDQESHSPPAKPARSRFVVVFALSCF